MMIKKKNSNKKTRHGLAMEFARKTPRGLWSFGDAVFCYLANSYQPQIVNFAHLACKS